MNRSISVTAVAALLVLSAQAAFADTSSDGAKIAAPVLISTAAVAAAPSTTTAVSMPATVRVRHAARIPGTFAIADATTEGNPFEVYGVLLPPMAGGA